jgi:hypothetical protein
MKNATVLLALTAALTLSSCTSTSTGPSLETKLLASAGTYNIKENDTTTLQTVVAVGIGQVPELQNQKLKLSVKGPAGWNGDQVGVISFNPIPVIRESRLLEYLSPATPVNGQYEITLESEKLPVMKRTVIFNPKILETVTDIKIEKTDSSNIVVTWKNPATWIFNTLKAVGGSVYLGANTNPIAYNGEEIAGNIRTTLRLRCSQPNCFNDPGTYKLTLFMAGSETPLYSSVTVFKQF